MTDQAPEPLTEDEREHLESLHEEDDCLLADEKAALGRALARLSHLETRVPQLERERDAATRLYAASGRERDDLRQEAASLRAESAGRLKVLTEKAEEAKAEWLRAEKAEGELVSLRAEIEKCERFAREAHPAAIFGNFPWQTVQFALRGLAEDKQRAESALAEAQERGKGLRADIERQISAVSVSYWPESDREYFRAYRNRVLDIIRAALASPAGTQEQPQMVTCVLWPDPHPLQTGAEGCIRPKPAPPAPPKTGGESELIAGHLFIPASDGFTRGCHYRLPGGAVCNRDRHEHTFQISYGAPAPGPTAEEPKPKPPGQTGATPEAIREFALSAGVDLEIAESVHAGIRPKGAITALEFECALGHYLYMVKRLRAEG